MLHTDIQKHLQELSLEDTLALAQLALKQARKKAKLSKAHKSNASKRLLETLKKHRVAFPKRFKFDREEANER